MTVPLVDKHTTLELVLFSGDRVRFRRMELPRALLHRNMLAFYLVYTVLFAQLRVFNEAMTMSPLERLVVVALSLCAVVIPAWLWAHILERMQRPGTVRVLYVTNHVLVLSGMSAALSCWLLFNLPGRPFPVPLHFIIIWAWFFVLTEISAHFVLLVLIRRALRDMRKTDVEVALDPTDATLIDIKGTQVRLDDLRRLAAEGNYIRVITSKTQYFLPGPFGPVSDALPESVGIRVSRSDWVAWSAIARTYREGRDLTLELTDGSTVRVAQTKRQAVLDRIGGGENGGASRDEDLNGSARTA